MYKDSSAKYYQNNKGRIQKKLVKDIKDIKSLPKEKKKKRDNMVVNNTKIYKKMKNKNLLRIDKKCYKMRKNILLWLEEILVLKKYRSYKFTSEANLNENLL